MNDLLQWIGRNPSEALGLGVFALLALLVFYWAWQTFLDFLVRIARAFTGKYPPPGLPRPVVECSHSLPCKCCRETDCQMRCDCWGNKQDEEETFE